MGIFDLIKDALIGILGQFLDRQPGLNEALRLLFLIISTALLSWVAISWRNFAYRSSMLRRRLLPQERYAGRYLQAVMEDSGEIRYTIVNIHYSQPRRRYEVLGRSYGSDASDQAYFKGSYILFPSDQDDNIEFIWQGRRSLEIQSLGGYTKMNVEESEDNYIQGDGFVMTFNIPPQIRRLRFKLLKDELLIRDMGMRCPRSPSEEPLFIQRFHAIFGNQVRAGLSNKNNTEPKAPPFAAVEPVPETMGFGPRAA